jgi:hypothetical protein
MDMDFDPTHTAVDLQVELRQLYVERAVAELHGSASDADYMAELLADIAAYKNALVGAVVTEIAALRADLNGRLRG